jgi:hypothetical protein
MTRSIPISRRPCWDGANISWVSPMEQELPAATRGPTTDCQYPLQDFLRTIGREMEALHGQGVVITETPTGFIVSIGMDGHCVRREYTHADLEARVEQYRRLRHRRTTSA